MCLFPKSTQIMWLNTNSSPFFEHSIYGQISAGHFQRRKPSRGVKIREEGLFTPKHQNNLSDLQVAAVNLGHFRWTQPFLMLACFLMGACGMPLTLPPSHSAAQWCQAHRNPPVTADFPQASPGVKEAAHAPVVQRYSVSIDCRFCLLKDVTGRFSADPFTSRYETIVLLKIFKWWKVLCKPTFCYSGISISICCARNNICPQKSIDRGF